MSLLRLTVTQLRITIVSLNLVATVLVAALPIYRLMSPHEVIRHADRKTLMSKSGKDFKASSRSHKGVNYAIRVASVGQYLRKDPIIRPVDEESTVEETKVEEEPEEPRGPDDLPPGPLQEHFVFIGGIFWDVNSERNIAILEKKEEDKKATPRAPTRRPRPRTVSNRVRNRNKNKKTAARPKGPRQRKQAENQHLLHVYQRWVVDEEEGPAIFVLSVTPERFVYEEQGVWRRYALPRQRNTIYEFDPDEASYRLEKKEEEEEDSDSEDGDAKKEEPVKHFYINHAPRTSRDAFDKRKREFPEAFETKDEEAEPATGKKSAGKRGTSSRSRTPTREKRTTPRRSPVKKPSKQELKEFKDTLKSIPEKDRQALQKALKGTPIK